MRTACADGGWCDAGLRGLHARRRAFRVVNEHAQSRIDRRRRTEAPAPNTQTGPAGASDR
ncbi:hypothetical protein WS84_03335 [Burkholderia anthina]|nr:hypothetical protein WS84_03335 [Burkholderia anthina]KVH09613.1 hypothetical protein WS85_17620 [Burkholderia anthina]KVM90814.1 hypothetical protein WT06_17550 [Burkholderia anthina]KVN50916.1 hypothetical protein WT13_03080 [Burkholderia anthina]KVX29931.1 hypothetical protein WT32_28105 [Burkholderia anthina]